MITNSENYDHILPRGSLEQYMELLEPLKSQALQLVDQGPLVYDPHKAAFSPKNFQNE